MFACIRETVHDFPCRLRGCAPNSNSFLRLTKRFATFQLVCRFPAPRGVPRAVPKDELAWKTVAITLFRASATA